MFLFRHNFVLGDSRNYMSPILVPYSAKCIATQILVNAKLSGRKDFIYLWYHSSQQGITCSKLET